MALNGLHPGTARLLTEAGKEMAKLAGGTRWICSQKDREEVLERWRDAVEHAERELR